MTVVIPSVPPPADLHSPALHALLARLSPNNSPIDLAALKHALAIVAGQSLRGVTTPSTDLRPLKATLSIASQRPEMLTVDVVLNAIIAYPRHLGPVSQLISTYIDLNPTFMELLRGEVIPDLVTRLRSSASTHELSSATRIILSITRSHDALLGLVLSEADYILPALKDAYGKFGVGKNAIGARSDSLMLCHALSSAVQEKGGESKEALKRLMGDGVGTSRKVLVDGALRSDYEAVFERMQGVEEDELVTLAALRDEEAQGDPRVQHLTNLFPQIAPSLLLRALNHPYFAHTSSATPEEAAAPLIDALLGGGTLLPEELTELRDAVKQGVEAQDMAQERSVGPSGNQTKVQRRNIWNDEALDISRLKLGKDESSLPQMGNSIPNHLRAAIMRLVESQEEEAKEQERALREAHGPPPDELEGEEEGMRDRVKVYADGDDSGEESSAEGEKVVSRRSSGQHLYDVDQQTKLELAYLSDPKVFDRDGQTRRGESRKILKEITGMDEAQLEGWRVMLERNPHKEAILARHTFAPPINYLETASSGRGGAGKGKGGERVGRGSVGSGVSGRGDGGNERGRGGGSGGGDGGRGAGGDRGRGGGRGGGAGGGRGRGANKGTSGHSNAARTRGHDKKMAKMGAGA